MTTTIKANASPPAPFHKPGKIEAPEGYEAATYWRDRPHGAGSWEVAYRRIGDTWWTVACTDCGHAHSTDQMVRDVARARVERAISRW